MTTRSDSQRGKAGIPVDSYGGATIDPTKNVLDLVEAAVKRIDDMAELRAQLASEKFRRVEDGLSHHREMAMLRASYQETLRVSDLDRLGKTREVDVTTGAAQASALAMAVQTLQAASDRNAEMIRNQLNADRAALAKQVADTAATLSTQTDGQMKDVNNRIAELQKSQYQGVGKSSVADPMMAEFIIEMKKMATGVFERQGRESVTDPALTKAIGNIETLLSGQATGTSRAAGMDATWKFLIAAVGLIATLNALGVFDRAPAPPPASPPPQVIYVPAPAGSLLPTSPPAAAPR